MRTSDAARILDVHPSQVSRLAYACGLTRPIGSGSGHRWSPGDVLALWIFRSLESSERYAEGARQAGWALDAAASPAFLVTRGGSEYQIICDADFLGRAEECLAEMLLQATDAGMPVRVVRLRPMVAKLAPFIRSLIDA
jgi:hypothetical protein